MLVLGLLDNELRDTVVATLHHVRSYRQAAVTQGLGCLFQQGTGRGQEVRPHLLGIDFRALVAVAVVHLFDDGEQDDGGAAEPGQRFGVFQRQLSGGAAIQGDQKFLVYGLLLPCGPWGCSWFYCKRGRAKVVVIIIRRIYEPR